MMTGRSKLVQLYGKGLRLDEALINEAVRRTRGVSAAFIKELMRRTAQAGIGRDGGTTIKSADLGEALDDMLFASGKLNIKLLGGMQRSPARRWSMDERTEAPTSFEAAPSDGARASLTSASESGGQSGLTFSGLPPLCTVGAAEFAPPASGSTALFSTAIEFAVFSSPLPVVAAGDVVQAVSGLSPDAAVDWAAAALTLNAAAKIAAAMRIIFVSKG